MSEKINQEARQDLIAKLNTIHDQLQDYSEDFMGAVDTKEAEIVENAINLLEAL